MGEWVVKVRVFRGKGAVCVFVSGGLEACWGRQIFWAHHNLLRNVLWVWSMQMCVKT